MTNFLKIIVSICFVLSVFVLNGQVGTGLENSLGLNIGNLRNGAGLSTIKDNSIGREIKGSSLLFDSNYSGKIKFINDKFSEVVTLNYDLLTGATIVYTIKENYSIVSEYVSEIVLEGISEDDKTRFLILDFQGQNFIMEVLVDGEYTLLKEYSAKLLKPMYNRALDTGEKNYTVKKNNRYFLYKGDDLQLLPKKSRVLFKDRILPEGLKEDFPHKKYSIKKEDRLIEVFQLINKN